MFGPCKKIFVNRSTLEVTNDHFFSGVCCSRGSSVRSEKWLLLLLCCSRCCFPVMFLPNGLMTFKLITKWGILDFFF